MTKKKKKTCAFLKFLSRCVVSMSMCRCVLMFRDCISGYASYIYIYVEIYLAIYEYYATR